MNPKTDKGCGALLPAMATHPLARLGFEALAPAPANPLANLGFIPATVTIGARSGGQVAVQPTVDPGVNQALAAEAMPAYRAGLKQVTSAVPGATLHATRQAKKPARLAEKILKQGQAPETVTDYGAAQITVDSPQAKEGVVRQVAERFPILRRQDHFAAGDPVYHYRSDTLQVQMPNQSSEELQIIPRDVMAVNAEEHRAYKRAREAVIAGKEGSQARNAARALNDEAMERFNVKNEKRTNSVVKGMIVKGARVRLADGSVARVLYVDPTMRIVRVRTEDGRNLTVRRKELELS